MQSLNILFTSGLLAAAVYAQMDSKWMTISYGYVVNSVNVRIDGQSMLQCAVQCKRQSHTNSCQVAGYNATSRRCQISFASSQDVSHTGDEADVILNMFDAPCSPLSAPGNGTMEGNGNVMKFECNHGYVLYGEPVLACQESSWNGTAPLCNEAPCDPLSSPKNGGVSTVDKVASFTCQSSYCMYGSQTRMCSLGQWNGSETSCVLPNDVCANEEYLVTGPNGVPDSSITVSSQYFDSSYPGMQIYGVRQARLNATLVENTNGSFLAGVWASNAADVNQYIQVRFPALRMVTAVSTRGRKDDGFRDDHGQKGL